MKKKMFAVFPGWETPIKKITAYFDGDERVCFTYDEDDEPGRIPDFYGFSGQCEYFDTETEAQAYLKTIQPTDEEIRKVFRWLCDKEGTEKVALMERIAGKGYENYFGIEKSTENKKHLDRYDAAELLANAYRGLVCINGVTFPVKEVAFVKRGEESYYEKFEIVLKSGEKVRSSGSWLDAIIVQAAFASNISSVKFVNLDDHED